ncbi:hypothetical protein ACLOJK_008356 [Asimina triloba]
MRSENLKTEELHGAPSRPPSSRLPVSVTDGGADGCNSPSRQPSSGRRGEGRMAGWGRERPIDARIRARARDLQAHRLLNTTRDIIFYGRRPRLSPSSTPFPVGRHRFPSSFLSLSLHPSASPVPLPAQRLPCSSSASGPRQSSPFPVVLAVSLAPPIGFTGPAPFPASIFPVHHPPPVLASHRHPLSSSLSLSLHPSASPVPLPSQRLPCSSSASGPRQSSPSPVVLVVSVPSSSIRFR